LKNNRNVSQITLQNARLRVGGTSENDLFLRIASEKYTMPRAAWNNGETCKMSLHGDKCFRCISVCKTSQFTKLSIMEGRKGHSEKTMMLRIQEIPGSNLGPGDLIF
jgi:hypothetical protein